MSNNKTLLATAVVGLLISGNAAAVNLQTGPALVYANELTAPVTITTGTGTIEDQNDDIAFLLGYNFSGGEVRYGRVSCSTNLTLNAPVITETSADISLGAINGAGTPALSFSITATNPVSGATAGVALNLDANLVFANKLGTDCEFSIYDQPSQAQAGGTAGRIYTTGTRPFATFTDAVVFTTAGGESIADVQATPAYTQFVMNDQQFGQLTFGVLPSVLDRDGLQITMGDIFAGTTSVTVAGSFDAANSVIWNTTTAAPLTTSLATFTGNSAISGALTYVNNGTTEIPASTFNASLNPVANMGYTVPVRSLSNVGTITRNGTQLQAPLVQAPAGWITRIALTNTGSVVRPYTIRVLREDGSDFNVSPTTGTISANGVRVIDLGALITQTTPAGIRRGTVIVTVDAPNNQIQGLYQLVEPSKGAVTNHVMVRPGTN